ncbi:MAG: hypothetical protein LQ350_007985 [Teloschistes chrysophthalmus]|nr:MAG: hypothetical protein LQ350_007985 [Niorma chrysophthalma]
MDLSKAISDVQKAAQADKNGTGQNHVELLEAIRKLSLAAETPAETLMRMRFEATGYDELLIARIMRLVTWTGICDEAAERQYRAIEETRLIVTPGHAGGAKHHFDLFFPIGANLVEYMKSTGFHQFPKKPQQQSPWEAIFKMGFFEFFAANQDQRRYFDDYMAIRRKGLSSWHEVFPMNSELVPGFNQSDPQAVLLVDVGGNWGHELQSFHEAHPDAPGRLIVQDLPVMTEKFGGKAPAGIEVQTYDFFTPQPVKGARAYYFRNICHDWPDEDCHKFLSNTAKAMTKGYSRLLIDEYVLPNTGAPIRGSSMDFLMMCFCSGIERTRRQWEDLLGSCGLEIVKVWGSRTDYEQVIEARLIE